MERLLRSWLLELRAEHKSEKTRVAYGDAVNQFIAFLADPPTGLDDELAAAIAEAPAVAEILDLKAVHVRLFMSYLYAAGRKPSTVNNRYRGLQQWFRWLVDEGEIEYSPFANLKPPQVPETPVPVVSRDDIKAILRTCKERSFINLRDEAIIRIFCDTGMRLSEMAGLHTASGSDGERVPHIDLEQQIVWVLGKGRRWRGISVGAKSTLTVDRYLRARGRHPQQWRPELWLGDRGRGPMTYWGIEQMVQRRCKQAGVPHIHPHQFRHTWAHEFRVAGGDRGDLKRQGGWRSDQMVDRYGASAADERARQAHKKISFGDQI